MYEIAPAEYSKGKRYAALAVAAPLVLTAIPAIITFLLLLLAASGPPAAAVIFFVGSILTVLGLATGLIVSGVSLYRRSNWTREMRERIAANGIKAEEIEWFRHELSTQEKRALGTISARDMLLGDAYRETLASRLTATRIVKSARRELQAARRRQSSLKQLSSARADEFRERAAEDVRNIEKIGKEADEMLAEAKARLQMIEAAASRHGTLADSEFALKKLSARASQLPLALEAAKMSEDVVKEMESELDPATQTIENV